MASRECLKRMQQPLLHMKGSLPSSTCHSSSNLFVSSFFLYRLSFSLAAL